MKDLMIYVKTTETCQLNCKHCFTNGINGRKIYFNPSQTAAWVKKLKTAYPKAEMHYEFHGGEPFLAPVSDMEHFIKETKELWTNSSYGITSNLVFKLTQDKIDFIKDSLDNRLGTSWDSSIRFDNNKQRILWENNVKKLKALGTYIVLFVSVTKELCNTDPKEIIEYFNELGVDRVDFERLTHHGNANNHPEIFPSNKEQADWFLNLYKEYKYTKPNWEDTFIGSIIENKIKGVKAGTFCRDCEQKLFTINADGTISGCPNAAPEEVYGHIKDDIWDLIWNPKRQELIACETARDPRCYSCNVFDLCGSGCHQLEWDETHCPSPKELIRYIKQAPIKELKGVINGT